MTRAQWDTLSAREKDAMVAEKVMGGPLLSGTPMAVKCISLQTRHFTTSWNAMHIVVEKLAEQYNCVELDVFSEDEPERYDCKLGKGFKYISGSSKISLPEAVCIAALTALGELEAI